MEEMRAVTHHSLGTGESSEHNEASSKLNSRILCSDVSVRLRDLRDELRSYTCTCTQQETTHSLSVVNL